MDDESWDDDDDDEEDDDEDDDEDVSLPRSVFLYFADMSLGNR